MKIKAGFSYVANDSSVTGILVLNDQRAISYPFVDPITKMEYTEEGFPNTTDAAILSAKKLVRQWYMSDHELDMEPSYIVSRPSTEPSQAYQIADLMKRVSVLEKIVKVYHEAFTVINEKL